MPFLFVFPPKTHCHALSFPLCACAILVACAYSMYTSQMRAGASSPELGVRADATVLRGAGRAPPSRPGALSRGVRVNIAPFFLLGPTCFSAAILMLLCFRFPDCVCARASHPVTVQGMPRRQLSSRHRSTSLLRRGLGSPAPRVEGRHTALSRLYGYVPSDDGGPSHAASSMARGTGMEGGPGDDVAMRARGNMIESHKGGRVVRGYCLKLFLGGDLCFGGVFTSNVCVGCAPAPPSDHTHTHNEPLGFAASQRQRRQ